MNFKFRFINSTFVTKLDYSQKVTIKKYSVLAFAQKKIEIRLDSYLTKKVKVKKCWFYGIYVYLPTTKYY